MPNLWLLPRPLILASKSGALVRNNARGTTNAIANNGNQ